MTSMTDEKKRRHNIKVRVNETSEGFYLNIWDADGVEHEIAISEDIAHDARTGRDGWWKKLFPQCDHDYSVGRYGSQWVDGSTGQPLCKKCGKSYK